MAPTNQTEAEEVDETSKIDVVEETVPEDESSGPNNKRFASNDDDCAECAAKRPRSEGEVLDLAQTMDVKTGDRLEVQWEIEMDGEPVTRWWGATLLEHDGRTEDGVAVRVIEYDPFPEGGFPESSKEDVIFMGRDILFSYPSHDELNYRLLAEDSSGVVWLNGDDHGIEELVDNILQSAMQKTASNFNALPRAQQALLAEKIAEKREKLVQLLTEHMWANRTAGINRVLTVQDAKSLLARTMMEG